MGYSGNTYFLLRNHKRANVFAIVLFGIAIGVLIRFFWGLLTVDIVLWKPPGSRRELQERHPTALFVGFIITIS